MSESVPWDLLTESAQDHIADIIELLASGFTGEVTLVCAQGGVKATKVAGGKGTVAMLVEASRQKRALTNDHDPK